MEFRLYKSYEPSINTRSRKPLFGLAKSESERLTSPSFNDLLFKVPICIFEIPRRQTDSPRNCVLPRAAKRALYPTIIPIFCHIYGINQRFSKILYYPDDQLNPKLYVPSLRIGFFIHCIMPFRCVSGSYRLFVTVRNSYFKLHKSFVATDKSNPQDSALFF
ncbi:hypothetical protein TNCV_3410631 [Trichonephila clavipes]|nr:hypothetical protein TNCV_3410631 [Trichonephila clavipes]